MFQSYDKQHDKCMGDKKNRLIYLCVVLCLWAVLSLPISYDDYDKQQDYSLNEVFDADQKLRTGLLLRVLGLFLIVFAAVFTIIFSCICQRMCYFIITGLFLILGGVFYLIYVFIYTDNRASTISKFPAGKAKELLQINMLIFFAESLLPSVTALYVGIDCIIGCFDKESFRLLINLCNLMIVSCLLLIGYYVLSDFQVFDGLYVYPKDKRDGFIMIATGYLIIIVSCAIYLILYLLTCCTCNCKDNICVRIILAILLIVGAVFASIGYYMFYSDVFKQSGETAAKKACFNFAFTAFLVAYCVAWAIDFAIDDVVKKKKYGY